MYIYIYTYTYIHTYTYTYIDTSPFYIFSHFNEWGPIEDG